MIVLSDAHVVSSCTSSSLQTPLYSFAAARYLCENPNNMQYVLKIFIFHHNVYLPS